MDAGPQRASLVDDTTDALRGWLATGARRPGDRLPPELELAGMLGVSRGTLRTALDRLEEAGEITRRQGSGTYVGTPRRPTAFHEGLEVLRPYSELAERRGVPLSVRDLRIAQQPPESDAAGALGLAPGVPAWTVSRTIVADGAPVAVMRDVVAPGIALPSEARLRAAMEAGAMVLDVLLEMGIPIGFARTRVRPLQISARDPLGRALGVGGLTAVLALDEVMHLASGQAVQHSADVFAPGGIDLQVRRDLAVAAPAPLVRAAARA